MRAGVQLEKQTGSPRISDLPSLAIGPQTRVAEVLRYYPRSLSVFLQHGFAPLSNPFLRQTMARVVTLEQACRREGVDLNRLLVDLEGLSTKATIPVDVVSTARVPQISR
jgi:hypothetical protein